MGVLTHLISAIVGSTVAVVAMALLIVGGDAE